MVDFYCHYHSYVRGENWTDFEHKLYSWLANRVGFISSKFVALTILQSCNAMEIVLYIYSTLDTVKLAGTGWKEESNRP